MPISNFAQLRRFSEACGAEIPRWIGKRMQAYGDDGDAIREFAAELVSRMCERLVDGGAPALHFYTLNLSKPTRSEEHTSELQSLMRISYAVFCLKKKKLNNKKYQY